MAVGDEGGDVVVRCGGGVGLGVGCCGGLEEGGGRGRKLQDPGARVEQSWKISEIRRCWTDVSCALLERGNGREGMGEEGVTS